MPFPVEAAVRFHLLEINVMSAQDLHEMGSGMHTYAVAWVHPERKLSTRVDPDGHNNPTWNDKFVFRIDDDFLRSYTSAVMIEIYCLRFFRDTHIGTVRVLLCNLLPLQSYSSATPRHIPSRFVALQIRRPSGRPQGIINVGVALLDGSMRSMPLYSHLNTSAFGLRDLMRNNIQQPQQAGQDPVNLLRQLRRTRSDIRSDLGDEKPPLSTIEVPDYALRTTSSVWSDSEVGPPPSVVAAKIAKEEMELGPLPTAAATGTIPADDFEMGSSLLEDWSVASSGAGKEDLKAKLERWKLELPAIGDGASYQALSRAAEEPPLPPRPVPILPRHRRSKTDGGGLFSCFGDSHGCQCSFFCGLKPRSKNSVSQRKPHGIASDPNLRRTFGLD